MKWSLKLFYCIYNSIKLVLSEFAHILLYTETLAVFFGGEMGDLKKPRLRHFVARKGNQNQILPRKSSFVV